MHHARFVAVELHEHVVPDFDVAVAIFFWRTGQAARNMFAVIIEDFSTGAARAGITHHPEIVGCVARTLVVPYAYHAIRTQSHFFSPDVVGFIVLGIHRDVQLIFREFVNFRQQLPRIANCIALEIIAEAEVTQHFEKSVVACGVTDIFQIVVLTAGSDAFLA